MNWLKQNYWRIILALTIGVVAYMIASPAFAALQPANGAMPAFEPKTCEISLSDLDMSKLLTVIRATGTKAYDSFYVFDVTIDGISQTVVAVVKGRCVIDIQ